MGNPNKTRKRDNRKRTRSQSTRGQTPSPPRKIRKERKEESRSKETRSRTNKVIPAIKREKDTVSKSTSMSDPLGQASLQESKWASVVEQIESELQCSICSELFIQATMLNCSHTFCKYCINMWKRNNGHCPLCRIKIKTQSKNITLESLIEKIVHNSEERKQQRIAALRDREELEAKNRQNPLSPRNIRNGDRGEQSDNQFTSSSSDDWSLTSSSASESSSSSWSEESPLAATSSSGQSSPSSSSSSDDNERCRRFQRIRQRPSRAPSRRRRVH